MTRRKIHPPIVHNFLHILLLVIPSIFCDTFKESALSSIHTVSSNALGTLCFNKQWLPLPVAINTTRYECAQEQVQLAASVLTPSTSPETLAAISNGLMKTINNVVAARLLHLNNMHGPTSKLEIGQITDAKNNLEVKEHNIINSSWWKIVGVDILMDEAMIANEYFTSKWSKPYYSCKDKKWLVSYNVLTIKKSDSKSKGFIITIDLDISNLEINQCDKYSSNHSAVTKQEPLSGFLGTHKCPEESTECLHRSGRGWSRGSYLCVCKDGFYSLTHPNGFNGSLMEIAWLDLNDSHYNRSEDWKSLNCLPCAEGCVTCTSPKPCMATYGWELRTFLLCISIWCAACTFALAVFLYHHRRARVFRSASPIFLAITLLGCVIMYFEMLAIYPVLDTYFCIATKWCRHLGFCITYTALLMKTWRVSLTYRVKSAHAVKLTERQLLRWLTPVLLIMLVYLGTWTLSDPPHAENITDNEGLIFKQCTYNWWDHSLAFGELLFLLWGVRVCYGVRHAESLYNEAKLISYAIYNIALVNCLMVAFHLLIFPQVGPDMKYFLGFLRTQLSTTVTIAVVFGPKVVLISRGFGDQWDNRTNRGVSSSFSLNGIGSIHPRIPLTPHDLAQENDELKEEIQKLAAQIEFMKIVQMELHNRHLRPKPGGHFTLPPSQQASEEQLKDYINKPG